MECSVELAQPGDFLSVAALDRIAWDHEFIPDGEHAWRVWCEYATVLFAKHPTDHEVAAGALLMFPTQQSETFLHKIMVHPRMRGHGLGTRLMKAGLARAETAVLLTVDPENGPAIALYENFGFKPRKEVKGYYRSHEHRLLMEYLPKVS